MGKLIFIHGISTSGKSLIGRELNKILKDSILIDQDEFYVKNKPLITFSNGKISYTASNLDCDEAIDYVTFKNVIHYNLQLFEYVIVTGFALRSNLLNINSDYSILLENNNINRIIKGRQQSKGYQDEKAEKDKWMVIKIIYPYYLETLSKIQYDYKIPVYVNNKRVNKLFILNYILHIIEVL